MSGPSSRALDPGPGDAAAPASEHPAATILEGIGEGFWLLDRDWRFTYFNRAAELFFEHPRSEALGRPLWAVYPSIKGSEFERCYQRAMAERVAVEFEAPSGARPGCWLAVRAFPTAEGLAVAFRDVTQRHRAEEALVASEAIKTAVLESALDCIVTITDQSRIIEWNPAAERTFGYSRDFALGRDLAQLIIPDEARPRHRAGMAKYLATGHGPLLGRRTEVEALCSDGSRLPVELAISPIAIEGRRYFTAYLRDLSERKQAEARQRESDQRLRATYEHAFAGIGEVDASGRFLRVNEQFAVITGFSREELVQKTLADLTHPSDLDADLERFAQQMTSRLEAYTVEKRFVRKDGSPVWVEVSASRVEDDLGRPLYGVRVVRDISERKRAEEHQLLLINELNHRVKNTLATVQSIAMRTLRSAENPKQARIDFEARLLALSRAHDVLTRENWEGADLEVIVRQAIAPYAGRGETRFLVSGGSVRLSPRVALALAMALQELATNAVKYGALSKDSGRVEIAWSVEGSEPSRLSLQWTESGGPPVVPPQRRGFGSRLIERSLARDLDGSVALDFAPSGLVCRIEAAMPAGEPA